MRQEPRHGSDAVGGRTSVEPALELLASTESATLEAVIRWYRPVLAITDDRFVVSRSNPDGDPRFTDPNEAASKVLMDTLERRRSLLDPIIRSVGRIELNNNLQYPWVGTGWIIDGDLGSDIIVTNAHVGREFGMRSGRRVCIPSRCSRCVGAAISADRLPRRGDSRFPAGVSGHRYHLDFRDGGT